MSQQPLVVIMSIFSEERGGSGREGMVGMIIPGKIYKTLHSMKIVYE